MRHLMVAGIAAPLLVAGCGGGTKHDPGDPVLSDRLTRQLSRSCGAGGSELSPALESLVWWLGDWTNDNTDEHWVAAGGAMYGISFDRKGNYEVMIVDDGEGPGKPDGKLRFIAIPHGASESTQFDLERLEDSGLELFAWFQNLDHDYPKSVTYRSENQGRNLFAEVGDGKKTETFRWSCMEGDTRAEALEEADRAFAADTAKRGIEGWIDAFAKDGAMLRRGKRIEGDDAIREVMGPLLASGKLAWAPIASGIAGNIGYTVGKATFTGSDPKDSWKSTYVTIWRSRNDGPWKVAFDTGRVINE